MIRQQKVWKTNPKKLWVEIAHRERRYRLFEIEQRLGRTGPTVDDWLRCAEVYRPAEERAA